MARTKRPDHASGNFTIPSNHGLTPLAWAHWLGRLNRDFLTATVHSTFGQAPALTSGGGAG